MRKLIVAATAALTVLGGAASAQESIKIGYIDPLSGGGASVGEGGLKTFQYLADELNAKGGILGHKVEIVPLDNKTNPQEGLVQAQKAVDAGVRYITQGNGSSVGAALEDFVTKNNSRNPGKEVLYFNYAAVDPSMTNEKCSYCLRLVRSQGASRERGRDGVCDLAGLPGRDAGDPGACALQHRAGRYRRGLSHDGPWRQ